MSGKIITLNYLEEVFKAFYALNKPSAQKLDTS
jgi:hypothetical protein